MRQGSLIALIMSATIASAGNASAQKDGVARDPDPARLAMDDVKEILLLMGSDKNGRITKEEWMRFMAAEFDKLDSAKRGAVDPKTITLDKGKVRRARFSDLGK